jgi:hypothetical protein
MSLETTPTSYIFVADARTSEVDAILSWQYGAPEIIYGNRF